MDPSKSIFGNEMPQSVVKKAKRAKEKHLKRFGDDSQAHYPLRPLKNPVLGPAIGVENLVVGQDGETIDLEKGLIIGNIRMGFGHYRIAMAIASCAHAMGYKPYWFDLHAFQETTGGKVIGHLNALYSKGSRWSQKYPLFNRFYWEPLNSEGFRKLAFNACDQKVSELMVPVYGELPKDMPFIATHVWPAQAAVHAGLKRVINVIPDNWPMGLHLAEGSIHTVQTPSSYWGYKTLKGMEGTKILKPMPDETLFNVGHYVDHELLIHLEEDCQERLERIHNKKSKRILLTIGGAGAQKDLFVSLIKSLLPKVDQKQVVLFINVGDHQGVWEGILEAIPELAAKTMCHFDDWHETKTFANDIISGEPWGVHAFYHQDIFAAVYSTNLLMRASDVLVTKPSELSFYPVPKLFVKRVGGHEAWGAIRSAEVGDGTTECESFGQALQMLDLMLTSDETLKQMVQSILKAHEIGIYNGGYKAVELAINKKA